MWGEERRRVTEKVQDNDTGMEKDMKERRSSLGMAPL